MIEMNQSIRVGQVALAALTLTLCAGTAVIYVVSLFIGTAVLGVWGAFSLYVGHLGEFWRYAANLLDYAWLVVLTVIAVALVYALVVMTVKMLREPTVGRAVLPMVFALIEMLPWAVALLSDRVGLTTGDAESIVYFGYRLLIVLSAAWLIHAVTKEENRI